MSRARFWSTLLPAFLGGASLAFGQGQRAELTDEELKTTTDNLRAVLAGPKEEAYLQVLVDVEIVLNPYAGTKSSYDLVVRYDPDRYRNDRVGVYPLSFEDQFILWGKRISLYTRSTQWQSGSFYLRDIGTAREAWISTENCRRLYQPPTNKMPPIGAEPSAFKRWLRLIYDIAPGTELRTMSRWLQLLNEEPRTRVLERIEATGMARKPPEKGQ